MSKIINKKAFEQPNLGVFYLVPDPKTEKYTIYSEISDSALHLLLWDNVELLLRRRFKREVGDVYRGIPRGRVQEKTSKRWVVGHGNDFNLDYYKDDIISEFNLRDAEDAGLVDWEYTAHETMIEKEKKQVEETLDIVLTKDGFKKTKLKRKK
jgi:hypothetical protein